MTQRWKTDPTLHSCPTEKHGEQIKKTIDYDGTYVEEFLNQDPIRDWESFGRCKWLWNWCMAQIYALWPYELPRTWKILDCGTKDGQFPQWLRDMKHEQTMGMDYSAPYVEYARSLGRPVVYGDICNMDVSWTDNFDFVFAHHVHGLTQDYMKGLEEMYRVTNKYMVALNQVPGNPKKHYSYIETPEIYFQFIENNPCSEIHNDYLETGYSNEWVIFIKKEKK